MTGDVDFLYVPVAELARWIAAGWRVAESWAATPGEPAINHWCGGSFLTTVVYREVSE